MSKVADRLLLIGGVRKSGTTSLFQTLAAHSQIDVPRMKEPQFLALDPATVTANLQWYLDLYDDHRPGHLLLDGSTWCFTSPWVVESLRAHFEDVRLVVVLRDPAKRAFSGFLHMHKKTPSADRRSFGHVLSELERRLDGRVLAEAENESLEAAISDGKVDDRIRQADFHRERDGASFETTLYDRLAEWKYFQESMYTNHLPVFQEALGDRLKIVLFEEMMVDAEAILNDIVEFAGLPPDDSIQLLRHENRTRLPRNRFVRMAMEARANVPAIDSVARALKRFGLAAAGRKIRERWLLQSGEGISAEDYERARDLLESEYAYWARVRPQTAKLWQF